MATKNKIQLSHQQIRPGAKELSTQDPVQRMPMVVSIEKIQTYDKNPRKHENDAFNDIKESIRLKGLEQPFTISRRPGEEHYIIKAGGNTRLTALHELYKETGDEKFLNVHVIFEPFVSETDTLISHLTENDLRGNLILIDRAQGIRDTRLALEAEKGFKLSARELSAVLKEQGYSIDYTLIGILDYALDRLYPHLTQSLDAGMGKSQVFKIRKFEKQAKQAWEDLNVSLEEFESTFNQALDESDQDKFDFNVLVAAFESATADLHNQSLNTVRFYVERAMTVNRKPTPEELAAYKAEADDLTYNAQSDKAAPDQNKESNITPPIKVQDVDDDKGGIDKESEADQLMPFTDDLEDSSQEDDDTRFENDHSAPDSDDEAKEPDAENQASVQTEKPLTLKDLRATSLELAIEIASEANIEDLVLKVNDGYGWILANTPQGIHFSEGFVESNTEFQSIWRIWATLFSASGATLQQDQKIISTHIQEQNNDLRHALKGDFESIESSPGLFLSNLSLINDFWLTSTDGQMNSVIRLIKTQRQIQRLAKAINATLWKGFNEGDSHE